MCPQLDATENFADGTVLTQAQLHKAFLDIEDFMNLVKIDEENIQAGVITNQSIADLTLTTAKYGVASIVLSKFAQEVLDKLVPTGSIQAFAGTAVPSGWLYCDGSAISRTTFSNLFSVIGIAWGNGDGSSTFNLPDLKGRFLRGFNDGSGRDPDASSRTASNTGGQTGDNVGSVQLDEAGPHTHPITDPTHAHGTDLNFGGGAPSTRHLRGNSDFNASGSTFAAATGITVDTNAGLESRPKNANVKYIIKI